MWDLIVSVPDHCSSFYFSKCKTCQFRPCFITLSWSPKRARSKKQERYSLRRGAVLKAVVAVFFAAS